MNKRVVAFVLGAVLLTVGFPAEGQQPKKAPRMGSLDGASPSTSTARIEAFRQGLRELGYLEGKNIVIEFRYGEDKLDRVPALAAELVRLNVDVIVTAGGTSTPFAKEGTPPIPIVMVQGNDPVGKGLLANLGRPSGKITGLAKLAPGI